MERWARFVVKERRLFLALFLVAAVVSAVLVPLVVVNYDLTEYLPQDMQTRRALAVMEEEFGLWGSAQVMAQAVSVPEALRLKTEIRDIPGVRSVLWLDDVVDVSMPLGFLDGEVVREYYRDGNALFEVVFEEYDHSPLTGSAVASLRETNGGSLILRGPAVTATDMRQKASSEVSVITLLMIPVFLIILLVSTNSWIEPLLLVVAIGISVVINMGTNVFLGEISFLTQATVALLQFGVSMDYSIFLLHRFGEERARGLDTAEAMVQALRHSVSAISASSLTTIAGFTALMFMRYGIGFDMGLVMAKGVAFSLLSVLFFLPALIMMFERAVRFTQHRSLMPNLRPFSKLVIKLRYVVVVVMLLMLLPSYLAQASNHFLYGEGDPVGQNGIEMVFGSFNPLVVLVPNGNLAREAAMAEALSEIENVGGVVGLATLVDGAIPREILPEGLVANFQSENYSRLVVQLNTATESEAAFRAVAAVRQILQQFYPERHWMLGSSAAIADIKAVVEYDFTITNLVAILAVGLIIMITFRSLAVPLLLLFVIQSSIWINMAIPYFTGSPLIFIGFMIVSAVQLGATIDYAILLSDRYMANRRTMGRRQAGEQAVSDAGNAIITSAAIMSGAGFILGYVSGDPSIASLGMLIGRGALLSALMVLIFLPQLLFLGDGFIKATTINHGFLPAQSEKGK